MAVPLEGAPRIEHIYVWINAFIPREVSGVTRAVPGRGSHAGKTMIPSTAWGDCFLTDQRSFDSLPEAKARVHSEFTLNLSSKRIDNPLHRCDQTTEVDCEDGNQEDFGFGSTEKLSFGPLQVGNDGQAFYIVYRAAASNPLVAASKGVGDIDIKGTFEIHLSKTLSTATVRFIGKVDVFPAFEAYAAADNGIVRPIFRIPPAAGKTALNLGGNATRPAIGIARLEAQPRIRSRPIESR